MRIWRMRLISRIFGGVLRAANALKLHYKNFCAGALKQGGDRIIIIKRRATLVEKHRKAAQGWEGFLEVGKGVEVVSGKIHGTFVGFLRSDNCVTR